ncbi:MAG: glycosyltransferase family 2 protein [Candidatus Thermoplasmatota archaeon]|nr:glycosyltransferase family 2 protein [Candidatus Thermoplasmatota archaeon]
MTKKISVIIPSLGRWNRLIQCIESILKQKREYPLEIIVILDGVSSIEAEGRLRSAISGAGDMIIDASLNRRGSPRAKNDGARLSTGDVLVFVDDDITAEAEWLSTIVESISDDVVGVGGAERKPQRIDIFRNIWFRVNGNVTGKVGFTGQVISNFTPTKCEPEQVDCLAGCNMAFSRAAFENCNGFDECYGGNAYREETDLCLRISRFGKLIFLPKAVVFHHEEPSGGNTPNSIRDWHYWYHRNNTYFFMKNLNGHRLSRISLHILNEILLAVVRMIAGRTMSPISTMYRGFKDGKAVYNRDPVG